MTTTTSFTGVTITLDKDVYNPGDTITATLHGNAVQTTVTPVAQSFTGHLVADNGSTIDISATVNVNHTDTTPELVKIASVTDGRVWTTSADGKTATATA